MFINMPARMLYCLAVCPVLLVSAVLTLTIDSQLGTSVEDCFERISIGEQLPNDAIYRNISELTTKECEQICKQDKQCQSYDYGVGAKGNATCNLSMINEKEIKEKKVLRRHSDYDVYVRRFQCEQSPPTPIQAEFDDPDGLLQRPAFKPAVDSKIPLSDELPDDSGSYGNNKPSDKPSYNNERPDGYDNLKPDYDLPPSYGLHKPQNIPYVSEKPQINLSNTRPDPYDVLQLHDPYGRPRPHESWRPEEMYGHRPIDYGLDSYQPEKPQYQYIIRPNRKPHGQPATRPEFEDGYGNKNPNYYGKPDYNGYSVPPTSLDRPNVPYKPSNTDPHKPEQKPSYSYNSQYASNYGSQYDNSIYLEINDPPRPYKPPLKPNRPSYGIDEGDYEYGHLGYGYDTFSAQNSYSHAQNSHSQYYGSGIITQSNNYRPYQQPNHKPTRPLGNQGSVYGHQTLNNQNNNGGYESQPTQKPSEINNKPASGNGYDSQGATDNYGSSDSGGYGSNSYFSSSQSYVGNENYESSSQSYYNNNHIPNNKPQYSNHAFNNKNNQSNYNKPYDGQGHSSSIQSYYGSEQNSQGSNGYENAFGGSYGYGSYVSNNKPYVTNSGYGSSNQGSHVSNGETSQTINKPYSETQGYGGSSKPPMYGGNSQKPYEGSGPEQGYESSGGYHSNQVSYGSNHYAGSNLQSSSNRPQGNNEGYGQNIDTNSYNSYEGNSQASNKPYDNSGYNDRLAYGGHGGYMNSGNSGNYGDLTQSSGYNHRPSSNVDRPISSQSYYNSQHNSQFSSQSSYESSLSYGQTGGSGFQKPGNQTSYGPGNGPDRPNIKPVYEYEIDRPGNTPNYIVKPNGNVVTSRPVAVGDYEEKPGYGRNPTEDISYKACFRRVLAGRRTLRSHVRRVINCERLEDCQRECAIERRFHCESFNYRLDPSFRGKGLCELMTKPIEAFDLRRDFVDDKDYDFYELDRNSLEPNCPDTLRGPGLLHSGFLSNKRPQEVDRWKDRIDWYDRSSQSDYERYYNERRRVYNSNRRYQNQAFVPYQIGISRTDADSGNWGQYGGSYGGYNYYKDKTDYRKSFNHWQISDEAHRSDYYGVKTHNTDFNYNDLGKNSDWEKYGYGYGAWKRGRWNSSWNGLHYSESDHYNYKKPPLYFESVDRMDSPVVKDCSSRRRPGMSLGSGAIRRSLFARNVVECEAACFGEKEFKCVSYSYRYSSSQGSDNCFLSERPYRGLDMSADSDSDVYAMPQDQGCATISRKPWVESECFWHVRSDAAVGGGAARTSLTVTGLGACEAECIRAHAFFCRGFSFRFDSPTIGDELENCILTSSPPTSLEIGQGLRSTSGHELYARGNYGRGCEPALYDDVQHKDTECYLQYDNAAKLKGTAVRGQAKAKDEQECGRVCSDAPFTCLSFSYKNNARPGTDNCLLSEIRLFDLQRGVDYEHSADDWLFAFDLFNSRCWRKKHGKQEYDFPSYELPHPFPPSSLEYHASSSSSSDHSGISDLIYHSSSGTSGPGYKPGYPSGPESPSYKPTYTAPSGPGFKPSYSPGYVPDSAPSGPSGPGYKPGYNPSSPGYIEPGNASFKPDYPPQSNKPVIPLPSRKPGYVPTAPSGPDYLPGYPPSSSGPGYKPGYAPFVQYPPLPSKPDYRPSQTRPGYQSHQEEHGSMIVSWSHYTVSGFPCRRGTTCAQNHVAGHWACEPEGGEVGSWDYCCAPTHRCGYSEGFQKPWCYVGPTHEQWRPCSEKYYPYYKHKVPHPSQGHRDLPSEPSPSRPAGQWRDKSGNVPIRGERLPGPYLADADRKYWDELYKNGPQAYYDKHGNPLPGYTRVPTEERPRVKYRHNPPQPGGGIWLPVPVPEFGGVDNDYIVPEPLGAPRYWPVAYLHKGPPPNMTYFRYNEIDNSTYIRGQARKNDDYSDFLTEHLSNGTKKVDIVKPKSTDIEGRKIRDDPIDNKTDIDDNTLKLDTDTSSTTTTTTTTTTSTTTTTTTTTPKIETYKLTNDSEIIKNLTANDNIEIELNNTESTSPKGEFENIKGIDGKLEDLSKSIEVFELDSTRKCDEAAELKTLEAEEKQIEAIGRLVASRRGGKLLLEKRSQKELESKNIAVDKDVLQFNFGNKFPIVARRGFVQRVSKDDIERERHSNDKSLEVSETTFVRPPRILSTTENIRKAIINGKVYYDATIREQRDLFSNSTRKSKSLKLEEMKGPSIISNNPNTKRKTLMPRNVNPVKRVRRVFRKRYNPEEVRKRLLEKEKNTKESNDVNANKSS